MHAEKICHKWLLEVLPGMHRRRLSVVCAVVGGAFRGGKLNVTSLGRSIRGNAKTKHSIKRADRLFSNENLQREGSEVYRQLGLGSLRGNKRPIILVDWSDIAARNRKNSLLASMLVDLKAIEEAFAERVLAQLHKRELISNDDVAQILSQDHTGFGVPVPRSLVRRGMARRPLPR